MLIFLTLRMSHLVQMPKMFQAFEYHVQFLELGVLKVASPLVPLPFFGQGEIITVCLGDETAGHQKWSDNKQ